MRGLLLTAPWVALWCNRTAERDIRGWGTGPPANHHRPPAIHLRHTSMCPPLYPCPVFIRYCCVAYREPVLSATAARTETARISQNEALILKDWRPTEVVLGLQLRRISILCET